MSLAISNYETLLLTLNRNDISGFQNRLGIFFFTLALFGFSGLSSLGLFANERILFMRERLVLLEANYNKANIPIQSQWILFILHIFFFQGAAFSCDTFSFLSLVM